MCAECTDSTNWDFIKTSSSAITIHGTTNSRFGFCVMKGRFIIYNPICSIYTNNYNIISTLNTLTCSYTTEQLTVGTFRPFVKNNTQYGGDCLNGRL